MPHCIIEHANDLTDQISPPELMAAALEAMQSSELFESNDIKIRTKEYAHFQAGELRENFIHITLKILNGRDLAEKQKLAKLVLKAMSDLPIYAVEITLDIQELTSETYFKLKK